MTAHGLRLEEGQPVHMPGQPVLSQREVAVALEKIHEHIDGDGEIHQLGQTAQEALPGLFQRRAPAGSGRFRLALARRPALRRQKQPPGQHGAARAQDGRHQRQQHIDDGRTAQYRPGEKEDGGRMREEGGQAVEDVGQHQFVPGKASRLVGVGQKAVGRGRGHEGQREGRARHGAQVGRTGQRLRQPGQMTRPAQGFKRIGHQQPDGQPQQQAAERQLKGTPEGKQGFQRHILSFCSGYESILPLKKAGCEAAAQRRPVETKQKSRVFRETPGRMV